MGSSETMEVRAVGSDVPPLTRLPTETRRMLTRPPNGATMRVNSKLSCADRSEEHTSELQSPDHLVCHLLLEKKKINNKRKQRISQRLTQSIEYRSHGLSSGTTSYDD